MGSNVLMTAQPFVEEINHHEIEKICVVGKGSFGTVYKAMWKKNQYVAVKYIEAEQNEFIKEVDQLSRISHRNIVGLYGACTQKPNVFLVMEFAKGGSLYNLLHCSPLIKYNDGHAMRWMKQCAEAVAYLHAKTPRPLIHRDLKSLNLLLVKDGTILKICDFGTATEKKTLMTKDKGTVAYMAPEVFMSGQLKYTEKCDIYSWSIIVWEVFSRKKPFEQYDNEHAIMYNVGRGKRPHLNTQLSEQIKNLLSNCWNQDPDNRPAMIDVVKQMKELCINFPHDGVPLVPLVIPEPDEDNEDNSRNGVVRNTLPFIDEIEHHEINIIKIVGKGSFGTVHKAVWRNAYVAVKYIEQELNEFSKEVEQLFQEKHPNIVRLYGLYTQEQNVCLVMELAEGGSLGNLLHCSPRIQYTTGHAMSWAKQCAEGVAYLHAMKPRPLIHRNLKSMSLLVMKGGTVIKISGFGTTTKQSTLISMGNETLLYMAPEVSQGRQYTEKSDVYSWGIILWEVFSRQKPFEKFDNQCIIMDMVQNGNRPQLNKEWPEPIKNLMTICWDQTAANRPPMSDVVKQVLELCKSFSGGDIPLAIQDLFVEDIDHHEINKFNLMGQGTFGKVYKAMWKNQFVAVKCIEMVGPLHRILHPNIVRLYGACTQKPNACILMEFCENSSLKCLLDRKPVIQFTLGHAISWMKQCAEALEFLHSMIPRPLIYRNLSLMKLLLVDNGTVLKLCEVRTATEQNTPLTNCERITRYTAPEVRQEKTYTEKADVYSWSMILREVFSRVQTFETINNQFDIMNSVGEENCLPLGIDKYPEQIRNLITTCWVPKAENRPTMSNIVKQMKELCKSFPGGNTPLLAIRNQLVEEIDHREINKFSLVGKGTFGTVYKAVWKNQDVAVKYIEQILTMAQISHPNIVHLFGMSTQTPNVGLVMEFCDGVSLFDILFSKPQIQYTDEHAIFWMKQCAEAFAYLHSIKSRPLMHWNFKTQNLLLVNDGTVLKICDICTATIENKRITIDSENNPYTAPEGSEYTEKCDAYSWGFLLLVLLNRPSSVDLIHQFDYGRETLKKHTKPIENIISTCCDRDPANRPTMFDVAKEMIDICKSHPGGDIPLVIPVPSAEENSLVGNDGFGTIYNAAWNDQYIAGHCINEKLNPFNIEFRSLTWISSPNKLRQTTSVPIIDRTSYEPENFEEFFHFLIADDCNITDDNGIELLKLAIKFKVIKLENKVINSLDSITWTLKLFEFSVVEKYQFVRNFYNELIASNYGACLINPYFPSLHPDAVNVFLEFDQIKKNTGYSVTEFDIFNALVRWINCYCTVHRIPQIRGRQRFDSLLKKIRFQTMSTEEFEKCKIFFPVLFNKIDGLIEPRKDYVPMKTFRKMKSGEIFETKLTVLSDVILSGLRVGIEESRKPFQIKIIENGFYTIETEVVVIEQSTFIDFNTALISLGDSLVLKPQFEYKIFIEYSKDIDKNVEIACRADGVSVSVDAEYKKKVLLSSSSDNMLEMMFASTEI